MTENTPGTTATDIDELAINTIRTLSMDAVEKANSGHPGTPMGLAPLVVKQVMELIARINEQGTTVLLVEQNALRALALADRAVILDTGTVVFDGLAQEVLDNESLRHEYLAI